MRGVDVLPVDTGLKPEGGRYDLNTPKKKAPARGAFLDAANY
jgi:hypothetical protein